MVPVGIGELLELQARTEPAAWRASSDAAQVVASYLVCHPAVSEVRYCGLKADPDFSRAANELRGGFGPLVFYRLLNEDAWRAFEAAPADAREQVLALELELRRAL